MFEQLPEWDLSTGMEGVPEAERNLIRELAWFYDNLGTLVTHGVVDIESVSGYLGGSVISVRERMEPLVRVERARQAQNALPDPNRWQEYFENLYHLVCKAGGRPVAHPMAEGCAGRCRPLTVAVLRCCTATATSLASRL
ncbi:hypothetical protein [Streptomyces parvulus]|uniref:DUF4760 domain-containing protein n=1 Tax=Streptomyces parvulus TaxID=146923 RepID=UPI0038267FD1